MMAASASIDAAFSDQRIVYDAPGTTSRAHFNVSGLRMPGLDGRPVTGVAGILRGVQDGVTFKAGSGNAFNISGGAIQDGDLNVHLGPEGESDEGGALPNLDLLLDAEIGALTVKAAGPDASPLRVGGFDNELTVRDDDNGFALYGKLRDTNRIRYKAQNELPSHPCARANYKIRKLGLDMAAGQSLVVAFDAERDGSCTFRSDRVRWTLEAHDLPSRLSLAGDEPAFVRFPVEAFVPLDTSAGSVGRLRARMPALDNLVWHLEAQDLPATDEIVLGWELRSRAFSLRADPQTGTIGHLTLGISDQSRNWVSGFEGDHVDLHLQLDLDGDTNYHDVPTYIFLDTEGKWVSGSVRTYTEDVGFGAHVVGLVADGFQVHRPQLSWDPSKVIPVNGWFVAEPDIRAGLNAEFKLGDTWYRVPAPMEWWVK